MAKDPAWKKLERAVARFFGTERTGPMQSKNASDINHDLIHCQCKHAKRHAILTVWNAAKKEADKTGKIPCVAIKQKGRHGFWLMMHSSDLTAIANQRQVVIDGKI